MKNRFILAVIATIMIGAAACNKSDSLTTNSVDKSYSSASSDAIAVGLSASTGERLYVVNVCGQHQHPDSIVFSSLPASVFTYLSANYNGYTQQKAFVVKDSTGAIAGYIAIISFNGKPVGLAFDASGNFVRVLEQRGEHDMNGGPGWHHGGCFDDRDGQRRDTIALTSLPAAILSYYSTNYPTDTLVRAFKGRDGSIIVLSVNDGLFVSFFSGSGAFINRINVPCQPGRGIPIDITALPISAQTYLSTTYPNYVLKHAFVIRNATAIQGYVVFIDANNTKYAVEFDSAGSFVRAVTIR